MEKQILEILIKNKIPVAKSILAYSAKEISELFKGMYPEEFIDYCIETVNLEEREEVDYCYAFWNGGNVVGFDILEDAYEYWLNKIKDK